MLLIITPLCTPYAAVRHFVCQAVTTQCYFTALIHLTACAVTMRAIQFRRLPRHMIPAVSSPLASLTSIVPSGSVSWTAILRAHLGPNS